MAFLEIGIGLIFWICQSQSDMGIWDCFFMEEIYSLSLHELFESKI